MSEDKQNFQAEGIMEKGYGFIPKLIMKDKELTIEAKAIYAYLSSYTGAGNIAYPSISLMCGDLDISEARFYKHRKLLIEKGYIVIEKKRNEGGWSNNVYRLPFKPYPQNLCTQNLSIQNLSIQNEGTKSNSLKSNSIKSNNTTTKETVLSLINDFSNQNQELKEALLGFKEMREKKKAPLTVRAMKMAITSLEKLSLDYKEQVEIIDQSTMNSWSGFYVLKKEETGKNSQEDYFDGLDLGTTV